MRPLSRRESRMLAIGLLVLLLATVWTAVITPAVRWVLGRADGQEAVLAQLAADQRLASMRPKLEAEFKRLRDKAATSPGLLSGASSALAAANLQGEVKRIVESNGGQMRSLQTLPSAVEESDFEKIEVQFDFSTTQAGLAEMVFQLDAHQPYVFVDALELHVPEGLTDSASEKGEAQLSVRWKVFGYRWVGN